MREGLYSWKRLHNLSTSLLLKHSHLQVVKPVRAVLSVTAGWKESGEVKGYQPFLLKAGPVQQNCFSSQILRKLKSRLFSKV